MVKFQNIDKHSWHQILHRQNSKQAPTHNGMPHAHSLPHLPIAANRRSLTLLCGLRRAEAAALGQILLMLLLSNVILVYRQQLCHNVLARPVLAFAVINLLLQLFEELLSCLLLIVVVVVHTCAVLCATVCNESSALATDCPTNNVPLCVVAVSKTTAQTRCNASLLQSVTDAKACAS